jgi:hypothetical protein
LNAKHSVVEVMRHSTSLLVAPSGSGWLDRFLGLPEQALARLRLRLEPA